MSISVEYNGNVYHFNIYTSDDEVTIFYFADVAATIRRVRNVLNENQTIFTVNDLFAYEANDLYEPAAICYLEELSQIESSFKEATR